MTAGAVLLSAIHTCMHAVGQTQKQTGWQTNRQQPGKQIGSETGRQSQAGQEGTHIRQSQTARKNGSKQIDSQTNRHAEEGQAAGQAGMQKQTNRYPEDCLSK